MFDLVKKQIVDVVKITDSIVHDREIDNLLGR
jgi:hypothetical protein